MRGSIWICAIIPHNPLRRCTLDIVIEVKNVGQNFKPEQVSLKYLLTDVLKFFEQAVYPIKLDGKVRAIFIPAKKLEFNPETGTMIPAERVEVIIKYEYVKGGAQPPMISDFHDSAIEIVKDVMLFLDHTNNSDLFLPAIHIVVGLSSPQYFVRI